jgi:hypothetical protein
LKGKFSRTLNLTDMQCGWVFTSAIRNDASDHMFAALQAAVDGIPYQVTCVDFDHGSEFMNRAVIEGCVGLSIFLPGPARIRKMIKPRLSPRTIISSAGKAFIDVMTSRMSGRCWIMFGRW